MPAPDGKRTSLASYTWGGWGSQNDVTRFRDVFQPDGGSFSPSYPLVPPEREQVRLWDYPVGYNAIYTPRSYEAIGFDELRALAESQYSPQRNVASQRIPLSGRRRRRAREWRGSSKSGMEPEKHDRPDHVDDGSGIAHLPWLARTWAASNIDAGDPLAPIRTLAIV
jgi:hypothetical protein